MLSLWEEECFSIEKVSVIPMGGGAPSYWEGFCYPIGEKFAILLRKFLLFLWEEECLSIGKVSVIPMGGGVLFY